MTDNNALGHGGRLPWELMLLVFEFSSTGSLAVLGRVASCFLPPTASLLYSTINIRSIRQLELLFCDRSESSSSLLTSPHLSFTQLQHLHLLFPSTSNLSHLSLNFTRLPSNPIRLHTLTLSYHHGSIRSRPPTPPISANSISNPLFTTLLRHLNPVHFHCEIRDRPFHTGRFSLVMGIGREGEEPLREWTRLETVDLKGRIPFGSKDGSVAGLPRRPRTKDEDGEKRKRPVVKLHLATHLSASYPDARSLLGLLTEAKWAEVMGLGQDMGAQPVELVVKGERERDEAVEALEGLEGRWRGCFVVRVER